MIVDALVIAGENRFAPSIDLAAHVAAARRLGLDALVAAPGRPYDYHLGPANDRLAEAARAGTFPIARLGRVDPTDGSRAVGEAQRCLDELGCTGLFIHPGEESFPVRAASDVVAVAVARSVPVVIAGGVYALSEPLQVLDLARRHPTVPIVVSSGGQLNISGLGMIDAWFALRNAPNLSVLTNGEYRQDFIEQLTSELDPRRVLMASFSPYYDAAFERHRIANARLDRTARALVEGKNAARLFHIEPTTKGAHR